MIDFKNVSKVYDNGTKALNNVNIHIDKGEFVFVVGASGAGKSTFLKLMMREEVPSSGTITIKDYNLGEMKKRKIPYFRRNLGIVFQDFRLIPNMTVYDNVAFAMRVVGAREKDIRKRVPYVINIVGLSQKARNYPNELSGGEQQRVALARALVNNADIIIADEPTGNVDPQMSLEIVELLKRLNETGTTVIMVTHAHNLVRMFDNRVIVLDGGSVVADGAIEEEGIPVHQSSHLNIEVKEQKTENKITQKFVSVPKEEPEQKPVEEEPDTDFLNAIISDTDTYRIYVEDDSTESSAAAEKTEGGDAE
ncbi:MAG: cell division ATP-binding protein FtsE [Acutalibacteraceae bacterium]|jgi:cell division transport system ATP-binding protein|nr:cell division ATP-binding protein FtsE [Clostridia bacterium]MEE0980858.1 cell division ATP-binding protein FtsE [Acutalibacteraceae bacterium]